MILLPAELSEQHLLKDYKKGDVLIWDNLKGLRGTKLDILFC